MSQSKPPPFDPRLGLCSLCRFAHRITNSRGSTFLLCRRAETDPSFRRYPPLPVSHCPGFESTADRGGE